MPKDIAKIHPYFSTPFIIPVICHFLFLTNLSEEEKKENSWRVNVIVCAPRIRVGVFIIVRRDVVDRRADTGKYGAMAVRGGKRKPVAGRGREPSADVATKREWKLWRAGTPAEYWMSHSSYRSFCSDEMGLMNTGGVRKANIWTVNRWGLDRKFGYRNSFHHMRWEMRGNDLTRKLWKIDNTLNNNESAN